MNPQLIVPDVDVLPLPGPVWLFKLLLHLTFVLHLLAMNFLLGGTLIAAVERVRGRANQRSMDLARWIERRLPTTMAFAVTLGVAPLLFVQALYGHLFYSASVVMAWPWFLVVPTLIVCYYLAYLLSFRGAEMGNAARLSSWIMLLGLVSIAFVYVNNMALSLRPESWAAQYFARADGFQLNLTDPTLAPRSLHMLLAAIAVAGLILAWVGARRIGSAGPSGEHMWRVGSLWFLIPTAAQLLIGTWFLLSIPRDVMLSFMGKSVLGTALITLTTLLPLALLIHQIRILRRPPSLKAVSLNAGLLILLVVVMVLVRDRVRDQMLRPVFDLSSLDVQTQIGVFGLFALLFVAGVAVTAWMVRAYMKAAAD